MSKPTYSLPRAVSRELRALWTSAFRDGDGLRWAMVRRSRELLGVELIEERLEHLSVDVAAFTGRLQAAEEALDRLRSHCEAAEERHAFSAWIASVPLLRSPLVSVVFVTLGHRPTHLRQSLQSLLDQSYTNFEVIVVSTSDFALPEPFASDHRFRVVHQDHLGIGRARNTGLAACTGEFVTYADDDNTTGVDWLRAVAWAFTTDGEADVAYGARLHEPIGPDRGSQAPFWWFEPAWDHSLLETKNVIDTAVLAHRRGLAEAIWDETLPSCVDWDLVIRLTARGRVKPLPVLACTYTTSAPGRVTDLFNSPEVRAEVQRRAQTARRRRLLAITHSFPHYSEAYVESELDALTSRFDVALANEYEPFAGTPTSFHHLGKVEEAILTHRPEVALVHYADVAIRVRPILERHGIPYGVRIHSYDLEDASNHQFADDPLCIGVWAYPHVVQRIRGATALPVLVHDAHNIPLAPNDRRGIVYTSSCLPKRDWTFIRQVMRGLPELQRSVFLATCHGYDSFVPTATGWLHDDDPGIDVHTDVPNVDVLRALTMAGSLLYAPSTTHVVGNPRSVVEAWLCGAIPLLPDTDEAHAFAGDHARYYTDAAQAIQLARSIESGGDVLTKERLANLDHAQQTYASPVVLDRFAVQFHEAHQTWLAGHA